VQSSHPYRVIEKDGLSIHSLQSLGRVGRILSGSLDPGALSISKENSSTNQQSPHQETTTNLSPTSAAGENREAQKSQQQKSDDSHSQCSNYSLVTSASAGNQINTVLQEPDVIASTKLSQSKTTDSVSLNRFD
jgi:WD repeat-containing protein 44